MSAYTLNYATNPYGDLSEFKQQAPEETGAVKHSDIYQSTDTKSSTKRPFSIQGITSEIIQSDFCSPISLSIYREAQDSLTDRFIVEVDENGLSLRVINEVKKADFSHFCSNNVSSPVVGEKEVTISGVSDRSSFACVNAFKFEEGTIVGSLSFVYLNFFNPESLISSIVLEADFTNSFEFYTVCLGSIQGRASFLVDEKSKLEFIGFKKITVVLNVNALKKLKDEGRLYCRSVPVMKDI